MYLTGEVLAYPRAIGQADAIILYSGDQGAVDLHSGALGILAGDQRYVGGGFAQAGDVSIALWAYYIAALGGLFEGAAYLARTGNGLEDLRALIPPMTKRLLEGMGDAFGRIETDDYGGDQATVEVHADGVAAIAQAIRGSGGTAEMSEGFLALLDRAGDRGDAGKDVASVYLSLLNRQTGSSAP